MAKCPSKYDRPSCRRRRVGFNATKHVRHTVGRTRWPPGSYLLLTAFVVCAYAASISIAARVAVRAA